MIYLVMAHRYGTNGSVYPIGIYTTMVETLLMARNHRIFRSGKYDHKCYTLHIGELYDAGESVGGWVTGGVC